MSLTAYYTITIFLGFGGFLIALYIRHHKKNKKEVLVCPLRANCDTVIHSDYSRFFGIPVEILGMIYYGLVALGYGTLIIFPHLMQPIFVFVLYIATISAFLFSMYLTFLQAFAIKNWCTWCLISASFCTGIFVIALLHAAYPLDWLLDQYRDVIVLAHLLAAALGVGAATISDVLFLRFLKDFKISELEADILNSISSLIWLVLAVLVVSGVGLYIPNTVELNYSAKFLMKATAIAVLIINGALLNLLIAPKLVSISFSASDPNQNPESKRLKNLAFMLGPVSIVSWYSVFILGAVRFIPFGYLALLAIYFGLLAAAIAISLKMASKMK